MDKIKSIWTKHKFLLIGLLLIVVIVIGGQYLLNKSDNTTSNTGPIVATVKKGNLTSSISASGQVQTANYLAVTTSVNGIVKKVFVKEGDKVVKGQKIMEVILDSEGETSLANAYSGYLRAKSSLDSAKNNLYSLESSKLLKEEAFNTEKEKNSYQSHDERLSYKVAENDYLKAKNDYDQQQANINQLQIALTSSWNEYQAQSPTIIAPTDGIIANIISVEGTGISNSVTSDRSVKTVASIKKEGTPIASLNVNELDITNVIVGQKVSLKLNSVSDKQFMGVVAGIDKIGSVSGGVSNYPVIVKFEQDSEKVLPNMGVEANIITANKSDILYVPTAAISTKGDKKTIQKVTENGTEETEVKTGITDGSNTEIISGVNEGERVLINTLPTEGFTTTQSQNQFRGGATFGVFGGGATRVGR